jgi:hypothetical protein
MFSKSIHPAWPALLYLVTDFPHNVQTISSPSPTKIQSYGRSSLQHSDSPSDFPQHSRPVTTFSRKPVTYPRHFHALSAIVTDNLDTTATLIERLLTPSNLLRLFLALPIHSLCFRSLFVAFFKTLRSSRRFSRLQSSSGICFLPIIEHFTHQDNKV